MNQTEHEDEAPSSPAPSGVPSPPATSARGERRFRGAVWVAVSMLVAAGVLIVLPRRSPSPAASNEAGPPRPGTVLDLELTLITSDRGDVACVSPTMFQRYACDFSGETTPRAIEERDALRPYMTLDRQVYLLPGLFLENQVQRRYQAEPPQVPRDQLRRFSAQCRVQVQGRLRGFKLRWDATGRWSEPQDADVATVLGCTVTGDPPP